LIEKFGLAKVKEMIKDIVNSCYTNALEKQKTEGYIVLERGLATIPLLGIDVPFQFAFPCALDLFFEQYKFERFVEIGPSPIRQYGYPHP
jgi:fatty acid synthase subunit alpha, fungi type